MSNALEIVTENVPLRVSGYDIDFAGIVSNIVYVRWLEDMRTHWCDRYVPLTEMFADGYCPIVLSTTIQYHRAIRMNDVVTASIAMSLEGRLRWRARHTITTNGVVAADAVQVGVFVTLSAHKPIAIPALFRAVFAANVP